ncbi:MAG TPA: YceD family protein [Gammaproteobacteria bacterium]|nr:YceD family protein [Gammaproteobacteria bacterium]
MSAKQIPEYIDPFRYAEQALQLSGVVNLADMNRLQPMINPSKEWVVVELYFGIDEQGLTFLQGHLQARLGLQCQRCMEPYNYEIITDFVLGIVNTDDEAKDLPECYEPVLTKEGHLALRELIEDEIILNLPTIPKHEIQDCKVVVPEVHSEEKIDQVDHPFHVLESLKRKQDK